MTNHKFIYTQLTKSRNFFRKFKLIYERNKWLDIGALSSGFRDEFIIKIVAIYKTIGDMFINSFVFEFQ